MGSDLTPTSDLSGVLIPWALSHVAKIGDGYDCADTRPGPFTPSARTSLRLEASMPPGVAYPSTLTRLDVQAIRSGAAGATRATSGTGPSAGIAYRRNNTGDWYGRDDHHVQTGGFRRIVAESGTAGISQPSMVGLSNGKIVACYSTATATYAAVRDADGVWTTGITVTGGNVGALACLCMSPDGALHIYAPRPTSGVASPRWVIACYRSTDEGATWVPATYDIGKTSVSASEFGTWTRMRAGSVNGAVALFVNTAVGGGPTYNTQQWVSSDGGFAFRKVLDETADTSVCDVAPFLGALHIVTVEGTALRLRLLGNPSGSLLSTGYQLVDTAPTVNHTDRAAVAVSADGVVYVQLANLSGTVYGLDGHRSADRGDTWTQNGPNIKLSNASDKPTVPALAFSRGTMVGLFCDATTARGMYEARWGGNTNATTGSQITGRTAELDSYVAIDTMAGSGYTPTTTGTPTLTLDVDANGNASQKIVCGAGELISLASPTTASTQAALSSAVVRITSGGGTAIVLGFLADDIQTDVKITASAIVAYDHGSAPGTSTAHGAASTDYIEVICISDPGSGGRSIVAWRILDNTAERTFSTLPAITGQASTGGGDIGVTVDVGVTTTAYVNRITISKTDALTLAEGWESPLARPYSLDPVPLSGSPTHLTGGVDVTMTGGVAVLDTVTQTMYPDATRRVSNVLPNVCPSPRAVWRSSTTGDQSLVFVMPQRDRLALAGIYLDGLVGVGSVDVTCGLASTTVSLTTTIRYRALGGNTVVPSTTGSVTERAFVFADELKGWRFKDAAGTVRTVVGNSEGSLTYGASIAEHRATIYLDDTTDAATNSTGTLYPARALLLGFFDGTGSDDVTGVTVSIPSASNTGAGTYREIGVCAAGRVHVFGESPDLGDTLSMDSAANVQTMSDGQRYAARRQADRRSAEIAFMDSPHAASAMFGTATSPDYVVVTTGARSAAARNGIPLVVEGIIRRAANTSNGLCVWIPKIPRQSSAGWVAQTFNLDATIYGRITSAYRREAVATVGQRSVSQVFRVGAIRFEEEL